MRTTRIAVVLAFALAMPAPATARAARPTTLAGTEAAAYKGDYQAQRNLAYGYVAFPYEGQIMNQILGCAWYLVVLHSGSPQVHEGDVGNVRVYCGRLDADAQTAAVAQARVIYRKVYQRSPGF